MAKGTMESKLTLWDRFNTYYRSYPSVGFALDISRVQFSAGFFAEMAPKMKNAFAAMQALEAGAIANPDENRMVGHYWLRDSELAPSADLKSQILSAKEKALSFCKKVVSGEIRSASGEKFTNILLVGIGGSALGPQLVSDALADLYRGDSGLCLCSLDNTDPDGIARTLKQLDLQKTLVAVVSKSGGTVETKNGMLETEAEFSKQGLDFSKQAIAITVSGSNLEKSAKDWLGIFHMFDWVGGRTSLFSTVGLIPAALEGIPVEEMLDGAREMDSLTRLEDSTTNPAALLAQMWFAAGDGKGSKDMVVLPYKDRLVLFSKYLQQLVMESLGKEFDLDGKSVNQGIAVYGNKGSTDQHAYVQQLRDGINNFFATFIEVLTDYSIKPENPLLVKENITSGDYLNGFLQGTRAALYENGRDSITLTVEKLTPRTLGAMIALYERAVGLYAALINVNAYHQPGVEAGKKAAEKVVALQQKILSQSKKGSFTSQEIAEQIGEAEEVESIYKILSHLAADGRGVSVLPGATPRETRFVM